MVDEQRNREMALAAQKIPDDEELWFLSRYLQGSDLDGVRAHCVEQHRKMLASSDHVYRCIADMFFLQPVVQRNLFYKEALGLRDQGKFWLEIGCAFGTDIRQIILDGWPPERILGFDVTPGYNRAGLELFKDKNLPFKEFVGNMKALQKAYANKGDMSVVYAGRVLHVLNKDAIVTLLKDIHRLLEDGGLLFGSSLCTPEPGPWQGTRWLHSPQSLKDLLGELGYEDIQVREVDEETFGSLRKNQNQHLQASVEKWRQDGSVLDRLVFRARKRAA